MKQRQREELYLKVCLAIENSIFQTCIYDDKAHSSTIPEENVIKRRHLLRRESLCAV